MSAEVGTFLATHRLPRGEHGRLAKLIGRTTRTLRNLRERARATLVVRARHRPLACVPTRKMLFEVVRAWWKPVPGHDGARTLIAKLLKKGIVLATRLLQRLVKRLKADQAAFDLRRQEWDRVHTLVLARDALWPCDESFLGRDDERNETRSLTIHDPGVSRTLWSSVGPPATSEDLVRALERTAQERGAWPLVFVADNGKANRSKAVKRLLEEHQVIALFNVPHTPQHNAFAERSILDLKLASGLDGPAVRIADPSQVPVCTSDAGCSATRDELHARLLAAREALDHTPRERLGGFTPAEIDSLVPRAEDLCRRARFYEDACAALARVAQQQLKPRARRRAEREAIWCTLEAHGLVVRTRGGGRSSRPSKRNALP